MPEKQPERNGSSNVLRSSLAIQDSLEITSSWMRMKAPILIRFVLMLTWIGSLI